jgi:hypothetical protein
MTEDTPSLCDESRMREILTQADADSMKGVLAIDKALAEHPQDPRLHFLKPMLPSRLGGRCEIFPTGTGCSASSTGSRTSSPIVSRRALPP